MIVGVLMFLSAYLRHVELQKVVPFRSVDREDRVFAGWQAQLSSSRALSR